MNNNKAGAVAVLFKSSGLFAQNGEQADRFAQLLGSFARSGKPCSISVEDGRVAEINAVAERDIPPWLLDQARVLSKKRRFTH